MFSKLLPKLFLQFIIFLYNRIQNNLPLFPINRGFLALRSIFLKNSPFSLNLLQTYEAYSRFLAHYSCIIYKEQYFVADKSMLLWGYFTFSVLDTTWCLSKSAQNLCGCLKMFDIRTRLSFVSMYIPSLFNLHRIQSFYKTSLLTVFVSQFIRK